MEAYSARACSSLLKSFLSMSGFSSARFVVSFGSSLMLKSHAVCLWTHSVLAVNRSVWWEVMFGKRGAWYRVHVQG